MASTGGWFFLMAVISAGSWWLGYHLGQGSPRRWATALGVTFGLMAAWAWLQHHPATAVRILPVFLLSRIEGVAAVPPFMCVVGLAWRRSGLTRQKRLIVLATIVGVVYYVQGGMWLLQSTPSVGFATTISPDGVRQSQEYSCVAASCATALTRIGIPTTEAEMAQLTDTRPGTGSTLIRALEGIRQRIGRLPVRPELPEPGYQRLVSLPMPLEVPLQFEPTRQHMVVIAGRDAFGVMVLDPQQGPTYFLRRDFEAVYTGKAIVLHRDR